MPITEPVTLLTDYALAGVALVLALRLAGRARRTASRPVALWAAAFGATALAATAGGTFHGFSLLLGDATRLVLWKITVYAVGGVAFAMLVGTALALASRALRRGIVAGAAVVGAVYAVWMAGHNAFRYVVYDYGLALVGVLLLAAAAWWRTRHPAAAWLVGGVLLSFAAAAVQQSGLALHHYFNHNDLYHVMQIGASWVLYRGASLLAPGPTRSDPSTGAGQTG